MPNEPDDLMFPRSRRSRQRAIVCDIDDTICTEFDRPITIACEVLRRISHTIQVHYVTSRPEESRAGTESFIDEYRLPGSRNVYFTPDYKSSLQHKTDVIRRIAKEYDLIASIGDADEDANAAKKAGVQFVRVRHEHAEAAWSELEEMVNKSTRDRID